MPNINSIYIYYFFTMSTTVGMFQNFFNDIFISSKHIIMLEPNRSVFIMYITN